MKTYIILLRGINVSKKNRLSMKDLENLLQGLGYKNIQTYIQSGNIILDSEETKAVISKKISEAIYSEFKYTVPVLIRTITAWKSMIKKNPYATDEPRKMYFTFLNKIPKETTIEIKGNQNDTFTIVKDVVYVYCSNGYGKTKLNNTMFEKKLNVSASTRNYRTVIKLLELATK